MIVLRNYTCTEEKPNCIDCLYKEECSKVVPYEDSSNRKAYQKDYYQKHKTEIQNKYASKSKFLRYVTVRSTIRKLSKQIGSANVAIVLDAIEQIEKE